MPHPARSIARAASPTASATAAAAPTDSRVACRKAPGGGDGNLAEGNCRRGRGQKRQRRTIAFRRRQADKADGRTMVHGPACQAFQNPVMPSFWPAQQQTDSAIQKISLGIHGHADRKDLGGKIGQGLQQRQQGWMQHRTSRWRGDAVRSAFLKSGDNTMLQPLQVKAGAATAVPRRDMRRASGKRCDPGARQKHIKLVRLPAVNSLILPVLQGTAATGWKSVTVRIAPIG